jgi:hypothetical protein
VLTGLQIADIVAQRAAAGKNYGVVLIPEGLVEYMHDVSTLIAGELCADCSCRTAWRSGVCGSL